VKVSKLKIFFSLLVLFACEEPKQIDFYASERSGHDLNRLPIIEPHQLITSYCCEDWEFIYSLGMDSMGRFSADGFSVDSLNYENGFIVFYSSDSWRNWGVHDTKTNKPRFFDNNYIDFLEYVDSIKVTNKLYRAKDVYNEFKETKKLPWKINK